MTFVTSLAFIHSVSHYSYYEKKIVSLIPKFENEYYFNSLISKDIELEQVRTKVIDLPGVISFEALSKKDIKSAVKGLSAEVGFSNSEIKMMSSLNSFKINLQDNLSQKSIDLIREYLKRIAGDDNILLGAVTKKINNDVVIKSFLMAIKDWPMQVVVGFLFLLWTICFFTFNSRITNYSYIIEKFQRRSSVKLKMVLMMFAVLVALNTMLAYNVAQISVLSLLITSTTFLIIPFIFCYQLKWNK